MEVPMHRTHQSRYELRRPGLIRVPTRETMTRASRWPSRPVASTIARRVRAWKASRAGASARIGRIEITSRRSPAFAAAVFVAELTHAPQSRIDQLAGIFVLLRVIYTALYVADQAILRSIVWSLGLIAVIWLFVLGV